MEKVGINKTIFVIYLGLLSIVGFLATDMYLPAFDQMRIDFNTTANSITATLSVYLAGFSIAQLLWGPIADKTGKLKAILLGMSIFSIATFGIYLTHNVYLLLVFRLIQAIGACSAAVSWQAIVIERYSRQEANRVFATIMPLVALSPALAPILGAYLMNYFSWRSIFLVLIFIALVLVVYTLIQIQVENREEVITKDKEEVQMGYFTFFKSKLYLGNVMMYGFCSAGFFAWLTGAPFFLKEMGLTESEIGLTFVPQTITFILGGYLCRWFVQKRDGQKLVLPLVLMYGVSMTAILVVYLLDMATLTMLLIPFSFMAFSNGALYPVIVAEALSYFPEVSGKAAALQNTLQMGICFLASAIVSIFSANALMATAWVMVGTVPFTLIAYKMSRSKLVG